MKKRILLSLAVAGILPLYLLPYVLASRKIHDQLEIARLIAAENKELLTRLED